jgi:hypothetical protein
MDESLFSHLLGHLPTAISPVRPAAPCEGQSQIFQQSNAEPKLDTLRQSKEGMNAYPQARQVPEIK